MQSTTSHYRQQVAGEPIAPLTVDGHSDSPGHGDAHGHSMGHVVSPLILISVFSILMVLTIVTVAVTKIDFGYNANLIVALSIALVKAVLVVMYFMHLRYDNLLYTAIVALCLLFIAVFIGMTIIDSGQYAPILTPRVVPT